MYACICGMNDTRTGKPSREKKEKKKNLRYIQWHLPGWSC
jgi:hypothetical protein